MIMMGKSIWQMWVNLHHGHIGSHSRSESSNMSYRIDLKNTFFLMFFCCIKIILNFITWATTCQNQQSDCAPSEDSDQPGHPPCLIRVFAARMKKAWVLSYPLSAWRRLWSDWADTHTHFVGFVMSRLIFPDVFLLYKNHIRLHNVFMIKR